jgi:CRISPR-associated protein Cas1
VRRIRSAVVGFDPSEASSLSEARPGIFAVEGGAGRLYMEALGWVLPAGLGFQGRTRRPPADVVNAALSYGYGILHAQVQRALFLVGLEPSVGFLHTDRWGRSSLTLDAMEVFRQPVIDRAVLTLARRGQLHPDEHTQPHGPGLYLSADGRRLVAGQVYERLAATFTYRSQFATWKQAIVLEARAVASYLIGHRPSYRAYTHRWA